MRFKAELFEPTVKRKRTSQVSLLQKLVLNRLYGVNIKNLLQYLFSEVLELHIHKVLANKDNRKRFS